MSFCYGQIPADLMQDMPQDLHDLLQLDLDDLVRTTLIAFRRHPHINNVMTHICGARWERIAQALRAIFSPLAPCEDLSPLAENIVQLLCAERGVTGRILKPYFQKMISERFSPQLADCLSLHIWSLYLAREAYLARVSEATREKTSI